MNKSNAKYIEKHQSSPLPNDLFGQVERESPVCASLPHTHTRVQNDEWSTIREPTIEEQQKRRRFITRTMEFVF